MYLPTNIHGHRYRQDTAGGGSSTSTSTVASNSCLALNIPALQVQLNTHEYAMGDTMPLYSESSLADMFTSLIEMSLNIDVVTGRTCNQFPDQLLTAILQDKEQFIIDGRRHGVSFTSSSHTFLRYRCCRQSTLWTTAENIHLCLHMGDSDREHPDSVLCR